MDLSRDEVLAKMRAARTLEEIQAAGEAQRRWLLQHPDDLEVLFNGEQLDMMESALREIAAQKAREAA